MSKKLKNVITAAGFALVSTASLAAPSVVFLIDGDTFSQSFSLTNNSNAHELITGMTIGLRSGFVFNTVTGSLTNQGKAFTPASGNVPSLVAGASSLPTDQGTSMSLAFSGFDGLPEASTSCGSLCDYLWNVDVDAASAFATGQDLRVYGSDLIGSTIAVTFSDGTTLRGEFGAVAGRALAAGWSATGSGSTNPGVPEPGSLALAGLALVGLGVARRAKQA